MDSARHVMGCQLLKKRWCRMRLMTWQKLPICPYLEEVATGAGVGVPPAGNGTSRSMHVYSVKREVGTDG